MTHFCVQNSWTTNLSYPQTFLWNIFIVRGQTAMPLQNTRAKYIEKNWSFCGLTVLCDACAGNTTLCFKPVRVEKEICDLSFKALDLLWSFSVSEVAGGGFDFSKNWLNGLKWKTNKPPALGTSYKPHQSLLQFWTHIGNYQPFIWGYLFRLICRNRAVFSSF